MHHPAALLLIAVPSWCSNPQPRTFVFEQEAATQTNAPEYATDFIIPAGTENWQLSVRCRSDGFPCRRASVSLGLQFDRPAAPAVRVTLRPEGEPAPSVPPSTCFEDYVNNAPAHSKCTVFVQDGWEADPRARLDDRLHNFVAHVENSGAPIAVHVTISVIDPLE